MTEKKFKPMLAVACEDLSKISFPVLTSPKLDGVRCIIRDGVAMSRSMKPIPNQYVQELFGKEEYEGLDGELIVGEPTDPHCYNKTVSGVMSEHGRPDVTFWAFDVVPDDGKPFNERLSTVVDIEDQHSNGEMVMLHHQLSENEEALKEQEEKAVSQGFEGLMLRSIDGPYKQGRSTLKQGYLLKIKRFEDTEGVVTGYEELMHNDNEAKQNALGHTERSTAKAGKRPAGVLGALWVKSGKWDEEFHIGTGFTQADREQLWQEPDKLVGQVVKFKYQPSGELNKPRFPVFLGFRPEEDIS